MNNNKKKLNVLMHEFGSVGYGLLRKFKESELFDNFYIISNKKPCHPDCIYLGKASDIKLKELKELIEDKNISFVINFDELYTLSGLVDFYRDKVKTPIIGTTKKWFLLEASKINGKDFMLKNEILTPEHKVIENEKELDEAISNFGFPIVVKNNFLQAGFGSYICNDKKSAYKCFKKISKEKQTCIAEKFISGNELSLQYFWDGNTLLPLLPVKDFKKNTDDKNGINTGGLGSYTPALLTEEEENLIRKYNKKLENVLKKEEANFTGIFTSNILFSNNRIYTLELNMRPGITEFETIIEHVKNDLLDVLYNCATGNLNNTIIEYKKGITGCVSVAHKAYIGQKNIKQQKIKTKRKITQIDNNIKINFNVTENEDNQILKIFPNKRFLSIICTDEYDPFKKIYSYITTIDSKQIYYRKDIEIERKLL